MALAVGLALAGCGVEGDAEVEDVQSPVIAGTLSDATAHPYEKLFVKVTIGSSYCSGTLLGNAAVGSSSWVLTAKHCASSSTDPATVFVYRGAEKVGALAIYGNPDGRDATLIQLKSPMASANSVYFTNLTPTQLVGTSVRCFGYGNSAWTDKNGDGTFTKSEFSGGGKLRYGDFTVKADATDTTLYYDLAVPNAAGQALAPGDSGGPCIKGGDVNSTGAINLTGILKAGTNQNSTGIVTYNRETASTVISAWIRTYVPRP
jgi:hypothetical protein